MLEAAADIDHQALVDTVEMSQQVMVLRGRYPAVIRRRNPLGGLTDLVGAHFQVCRHGRGDVVGLACVDYALADALSLFDEGFDTRTGHVGRGVASRAPL